MDSDSDDDLVAPDFLTKAPPLSVVLTPRKAIRPSGEETLSPLPVLKDGKEVERKCKGKISMGSLLTEKKKEDAIQQNAESIMRLKEKFANEDYMEYVGDNYDLNCSQVSLSQDFDDSQDLSQDHHEREQDFGSVQESYADDKENMFPVTNRFINDFPDTFPGEKYFIHYIPVVDLKLVTRELFKYTMEYDEVDEDALDENGLLYVILQVLLPLQRKIPCNICKLLWQVLCCSQDYKTSETALQILSNYVLSKNTHQQWLPEVDDLIEALAKCGASIDILIPEHFCELMDKELCYHTQLQHDTSMSRKSIRKSFDNRLHNLRGIIKLITISLQCYPHKFSRIDLNCLLLTAMRLTIEKVVQNKLSDLIQLIDSLLEAYDGSTWAKETRNICELVMAFDMHHRNLLQLVESIPPSQRGYDLQQLLAFNISSSLIRKNSAYQVPPVKIADVFTLVSSIKVSEDSDYFCLYSALSLIGLCMHTDDVTAGQKTNLIKLKDKLQLLHGEIKECKGAYLDRTKVKDVILRMVSKFKFAALNVHCQSQLESYFGVSNKDIDAEVVSTLMLEDD